MSEEIGDPGMIGVMLDSHGNKKFISPKAAELLAGLIERTEKSPFQDAVVTLLIDVLEEKGEITRTSELCDEKCVQCEQIGCPLHPQSIYEMPDQSAPTGPIRKDN